MIGPNHWNYFHPQKVETTLLPFPRDNVKFTLHQARHHGFARARRTKITFVLLFTARKLPPRFTEPPFRSKRGGGARKMIVSPYQIPSIEAHQGAISYVSARRSFPIHSDFFLWPL